MEVDFGKGYQMNTPAVRITARVCINRLHNHNY